MDNQTKEIHKQWTTYITFGHAGPGQPCIGQAVIKAVVFAPSGDRRARAYTMMFTETHEEWYGRNLRITLAKTGRNMRCECQSKESSLHRNLRAI